MSLETSSSAFECQQRSRTWNGMVFASRGLSCLSVERISNMMRVGNFGSHFHCRLTCGCVLEPKSTHWACWGCAEYTKTNDACKTRPHCASIISSLIRHSPVSILPPRDFKLSPSPITNYPSLNTLLMNTIKVFNGGKHVARQRKML